MKYPNIILSAIIFSAGVFSVHTSFAGSIEGYVYGIMQDSMGIDTIPLDSAMVHGEYVNWEEEFTVYTNGAGYYIAQNLSNGSWFVTASHPGFIPQTKSWTVPPPQRYLKFYLYEN